jgi:hypothetical protein
MSKINVTVKSFNVEKAHIYHMVKNGTNYDMVAIHTKGGVMFGNNAMHDGILIISSIGNRAQLFSPETPAVFDPLYVGEKLQDYHRPTEGDMPSIMQLLQAIVSPNQAQTELEMPTLKTAPFVERNEFDMAYQPDLLSLMKGFHVKTFRVEETDDGLTVTLKIPFSAKHDRKYVFERFSTALAKE